LQILTGNDLKLLAISKIYLATFAIVACCTLLSFLSKDFLTEGDVAMIYLLGVVAVSSRFSWMHSITAVFLSVALTNFLFVPPFYTFHVENIRSVITFIVMFIVGTVVTWLSVSLRKHNEEMKIKEAEKTRFMQQNEENRIRSEKEKLKNDLLSSIAHDLRTPLSSISGTASVLLQKMNDIKDDTRSDMLKTISDEAFRLGRLVENILNITKLESTDFVVKKVWYPLEEIIGSAVSRVEKLYKDRELRISIPDEMIMIKVDPILIEQVIINLLENAAKYSFEKTSITVYAEVSDNLVVVGVVDKGPGVKETNIPEIFEKFQQFRSNSDMNSGSGIGLSVCKAIIKVHKGLIFAENTPDGFKVAFSLPFDETFKPEEVI